MQDFGKNIQNVKDKIPDIKNADFKIFQFEHLYFYSYIICEGISSPKK